jgi:NAD(P)-dependent dehydrogenase (short-subunit alcohol dehydrogenase family)
MNKTALVWGAGGGIGQAIVQALLEQDWKVLAAGRHLKRLSDMDVITIEAELQDHFSVQTAVSAAAQEAEEVHLWVYCAGDITSEKVEELPIETWQRILDANLTGAFLTTHHSWPLLADNAHLFYLGAVSERMRLPGLAAYASAKAGLESFAEVVRKESRRKVSIMRPAAVDTALWEKVPFKKPTRCLTAQEVATQLLQAYQEGHQGLLDL